MSDVILHVHYKSASQPSNNVQDLLKFVSNWWKKKIEKKIKTKFTFNTPCYKMVHYIITDSW
jgi:hypothetical protein